ncbi:TPA: hypothetical protein MBF47_003866 [Klebsiella pneumoniae]|uniref:hypothetical protein n=1 Tax=Klebsiella pneumoniae TaxID=573 RepID=UPI00211875CA|nr:hypothetical protein [Klebsiella pneumoniae]MCJ7283280.1 hypothetical protein [Klebsiella pneumoniae]MCQ8577022.1 hypothetical protein [Klebsiella pneumoniae]MEA4772117.1 hypothetical protein [Klebsiella pneumoniae]MEB5543202.1 hypothetical protein [Klebsiella pneumoniae]HBT3267598.1 hypothetical protein [Klebsiella pneumoniae]
MKEMKLIIEIDDSAIDSVIEKVRLLKDELCSLGVPVNMAGAATAAASLQPEDKRDAQDLWDWYISELDSSITRAYSELTELLNMRRRATSSV